MRICYTITADAYLFRALDNIVLFRDEENVGCAIYAALELCNAIERTLFEYLALFKEGELEVTLSIEEYHTRTKELIQRIDVKEPEFEYKLKFIEACLNAITDEQYNIVIPDLKKLNRVYGELVNYRHASKEPAKTSKKYEWYETLKILILETMEYSTQILSNHSTSILKIDDRLLKICEEFYNMYPQNKQFYDKLKLFLMQKDKNS